MIRGGFLHKKVGVLFYGIVFLFCLFSFSIQASAQTLSTVSQGVTLSLNPQFPAPHSSTKVTLDDYSVDSLGATIQWYIDGIEQTAVKNDRSIEVPTGALGEKISVRVRLSRNGVSLFEESLTLKPTVVDLIIESDSYTPSFYKGRALPSGESPVHVIALVHDGLSTPESAYTYKWSLDDSILLGGPVKGKNILDTTMPRYSDTVLTVEIFDTAGQTIGTKSITLNPITPEFLFYENSPLRGLSGRALREQYQFVGEETTIFGEPYYTNARMRSEDATFTWKINGKEVEENTSTPNAITLERSGEGGRASLSFRMVTNSRIPQLIEKTLSLIF